MSTPNAGIPYLPPGALDVSAGVNLALNVIDVLLQTRVLTLGTLTAPPGSPSDGDLHVPGTGSTGAWAGLDNYVVRYVAEGDFWQSYEPGVQAKLLIGPDGGLYVYSGAWLPAVAGAQGAPVVELAGDAYDLGDLTPGAWHVFTSATPVVITVEDEADQPVPQAAEYGIEARGAGGVTIEVAYDGVADIIPPKLGTLELEEGDFAVLKRTAADVYKLIGSTVAAP